MCLHNNRRFRTRVRFALGGTALFIRTSLEKAGFWRPLLKFLSSFVGVTAARLIDGVAVLTAGFLVLDSGLTMLEAQGVPREHLDTESESGNESVDSRLFNKTHFPTARKLPYDTHAPPVSLAYLRSPLRPFGMPSLAFSRTHLDAIARARLASRSPAGSDTGDGWSGFGSGSVRSDGSGISGSDEVSAVIRAMLAAGT